MEQKESVSKDSSFEQDIYSWTLFFRSNEYEETFQREMRSNTRFNATFRILTYVHVASAILYRIAAVISIYTTNFFKTADVVVETALLIFIIAAAFIEAGLRCFPRLRLLQGFFIYTSLGIFDVTGAFYTQRAPLFGIAYYLGLYNNSQQRIELAVI